MNWNFEKTSKQITVHRFFQTFTFPTQVMELLLFKNNTSATIDFSIETLRKETIQVFGQRK